MRLFTAASLSTLLLTPLFARAQQPEIKPDSPAPQMEDIATPAPPRPIKLPAAETPAADASQVPPARPAAQTIGHGFLVDFDRSQVLFDEPGDGRIWAAADAYKASFGAEGATYVPFFGSRAPQNYPVRFELVSLSVGGRELVLDHSAAPVRRENRIVFARGPVDEVYDLSTGLIEQSFVLTQRCVGEIVIEIGVESELARSQDDQGLVLASALGSVRYGRAFVLDAQHAKTEVAASWQGGVIRITVPAERTAVLGTPLVIDPLITTFDVDDDTTVTDTNPDLAYDTSNANWMVVYERLFSATDHDVFYRIFTTAGGGVSQGSIDITATYWGGAKVANNNIADQYLCVAAAGDPALAARTIRGRTRGAAGGLGSQFTISGGEIGDKYAPDVGGDPHVSPPTYYCVVWQRDTSSANHDIHARLVTIDATIFGSTIFVSNSAGTLDNAPSISKSDGYPPAAEQDWNLVWQRDEGGGDNDLWAAQLHWNGSLTTPPFAVDTSTANTFAARVSTSTSDSLRGYLIACTRSPVGFASENTYGIALHDDVKLDEADLTLLAGAPAAEHQLSPSVDCDGALFVVADQESIGGASPYNVFASTFQLVGSEIVLAEGHQALAATLASERVVEVACAASSGGAPRTTLAVWSAVSLASPGDIVAGWYDASPFATYCEPGTHGVPACNCGNAPSGPERGCNNSNNTGGASLSASGGVDPDTVVLHASSMLPSTLCVFAQGLDLFNTGASWGDGIVCAGGTVLRLGIKAASAGSADYPTGADPSLTERAEALGFPIAHGSKALYFVYYRDAATYACSGAFNVTTTLQVQW